MYIYTEMSHTRHAIQLQVQLAALIIIFEQLMYQKIQLVSMLNSRNKV